MNGTRWRAAALLVAVFIIGLLVGFEGRALARRHVMARARARTPAAMADRLARRLDLNAAQRDSVRLILERHRPEMDSLWRDFQPRLRELERSLNGEISAQLDTAQQRKFAELTSHRGHRRPGPPPPNGADR
ncbi:MAG TPA: periplasmic heavy metal sensor [Gemmatimonadales bacterium]|nr:periplasmic heavy metal sensor [Gemmatimonadales bacterium]